MAIGSEDEQLRLRDELIAYGCKVTEVRDRCYFTVDLLPRARRRAVRGGDDRARVPVDEELSALGRGLKLPPWEEPNRRRDRSGAGADTSR